MPFKDVPEAAFKVWEKVHDVAVKGGDDEETASKKAWGAVKHAGWRKGEDGKWVKDALVSFSMHFVSAPLDKATFEMRFRSVASDTQADLYDEHMTPELYKSFMENEKKPVPDEWKSFVCDEAWSGGKPYVSLSHYPSLNGKGIAGVVDETYIDGIKFKSKGHFNDTPLGRACYRALCKDLANKSQENKIRVSIGFLDLAHKHGANGEIFERKSQQDECEKCLNGEGDKYYMKGILVHEAMTRVPVNPRAEMEVERSMGKKTRAEDALSVVEDPELVDELEKESKSVNKALVELSDTEDALEVSEDAEQDAELKELPLDAIVEESEAIVTGTDVGDRKWDGQFVQVEESQDRDKAKAAQKARSRKYGIAVLAQGHVTKPGQWASVPDSQWGDPVNYRYPMPDDAHVRNAASRYGQEKGSYRGKGTVGERIHRREKSKGIGKDASKEKSMTEPVVEKTGTVVIPNKPSDDDLSNLPYGGSVALPLEPKVWQRGTAQESLESLWTLLNDLMDNIYKRPDVVDKANTMKSLLAQVKDLITVKSQMLATPFSNLVAKIMEVKSMAVSDEERLQNVQPAFEALGEAIKAEVKTEVVSEAPADSEVMKALRELSEKFDRQTNEIAVLKAQLANAPRRSVNAIPVPQPRSVSALQANLVAKSQATKPTSKLHDLVAKRAGLDPQSY